MFEPAASCLGRVTDRPPASMLYQASGVAIDGRALLITGPPGVGKTSLALALIDRGAQLIGDDGVMLCAAPLHQESQLLASPAPEIEGLIEIRNVGLVTLPAVSAVRVGLILELVEEYTAAPRLPDPRESTVLLGHEVPRCAFWPGSICPAVRAEYALGAHGV